MMESQSQSSTHQGDDQPLEIRQSQAAIHNTQSDASVTGADEVRDESTSKCDLKSNKKEAEDDSMRGNEQKSNSDIAWHQIRSSPGVSISRSVSQGTEQSSSSVMNKTPSRAVFHDLPTAYLCITSGLARIRSQNASNSVLEAPLEDGAVQPEDPLRPSNLADDLFQLQHLPPMPAPAASKSRSYNTPSGKPSDEDNKQLATQNAGQSAPVDSAEEGRANLHASISNPPAETYSSDVMDKTSSLFTESPSPQQSSNFGATNGAPKLYPRQMLGAAAKDNNSVSIHGNPSPMIRSSHLLWAPEGSTVNNIYRHYVGSSTCGESENATPKLHFDSKNSGKRSSSNGLSFSSQSDSHAKPSALDVRKQRRVDRLMTGPQSRPPSCALPGIPASSLNRHLPNIRHGLDQSSSYGDTRNLLEIPERSDLTIRKPTLTRSDGRHELRLQKVVLESGDNVKSSVTTSRPTSPLHFSCHPTVASLESDADCTNDDGQYIGGGSCDRQPLEREVSHALRRASGCSVFSSGSVSSFFLDHEDFEHSVPSFKSNGFNKRARINDTLQSEPQNSSYGTQNIAVDAQRFYDERAIPSSWITPHQRNAVRVPVNRKGMHPNSPCGSLLEPTNMPLRCLDDAATEGDANDWETVGESRFGAEYMESQDGGKLFEVSTIHRTGSSLANTSNDGTASLYNAKLDDYGSTERITQHPGIIHYSGDYRQQDLNNSPTPNFPPIYREHKVNGYLADLTRRHLPSSPFNHVQKPLKSPHDNPFKSPPPEDLSSPPARRTPLQKRNNRVRKPNHFPPSMKTISTTEEDSMMRQDMGSISSALTPTTLAERERTYRKLNWNAESTDPCPPFSHSKRQLLSPINPVGRPDRPSSWRHLIVFGRGDKIEGWAADGTPEKEPSTLTQADSSDSNWHGQMHDKVSVELRRLPERRRLTNTREHQPLVKGPPGALYQGIARSQQNPNATDFSDTQGGSAKISSRYTSPKDYPTNALRPLSLLANYPVTPIQNENKDHLPARHQSSLMYRSPLATPRRLSWQELYTEAQLKIMQEAAGTDSWYDVSLAPNTGSMGRDMREEPTYRHLYEDPASNQQPSLWTRESSARMDLCDKKRKLSTFVLLFCALCPPLLVLFALGHLDQFIAWWSKGELTAFEDKQKKLAQILASLWGFAILVGIIIILVFRFVPSTSTT